jgi:hypothetical protein
VVPLLATPPPPLLKIVQAEKREITCVPHPATGIRGMPPVMVNRARLTVPLVTLKMRKSTFRPHYCATTILFAPPSIVTFLPMASSPTSQCDGEDLGRCIIAPIEGWNVEKDRIASRRRCDGLAQVHAPGQVPPASALLVTVMVAAWARLL